MKLNLPSQLLATAAMLAIASGMLFANSVSAEQNTSTSADPIVTFSDF